MTTLLPSSNPRDPRHRFTEAEEAAIVAAVLAGDPVKAVAFRFGAPLGTVYDAIHRHGVRLRACDDEERLRQRERWKRNTAAMRERRNPDR